MFTSRSKLPEPTQHSFSTFSISFSAFMLAITIATRGRSSMRWYNSNIQNWTSVTVRRSALRQYNSDAQKSAYDYYRRKNSGRSWFQFKGTLRERNVQVAWYGLAVVIGAIGATYAAVPLYKVFCQTTGFGGTTQRVNIGEESPSMISSVMRKLANTGGGTRVHTWTDEEAAERLATLRPVQGADLLTVRFDTTVGSDAFPWTFVPVHLDVKVVPGETALAFFRVTNHSDKPLTGVATYNVHPPKVGLYFQKIQCFCFEEQRLLPGETVDMPVFFFVDPAILDDPQVSYIRSITLSYTFFPTENDEEDEEGEDWVQAQPTLAGSKLQQFGF